MKADNAWFFCHTFPDRYIPPALLSRSSESQKSVANPLNGNTAL